MLREMLGCKKEDVTGYWRRLHDLKSSVNIIRVIKFRRMGWAVYVTHTGEKRNAYRIWVGKREGRDCLKTEACMDG